MQWQSSFFVTTSKQKLLDKIMTSGFMVTNGQLFTISHKEFIVGIQERKEREREQRKSIIIDCALKVFLAKGIRSSSMEEVAECSELSKATLYLYFKNKEEIIMQVMNSVMTTFIEYLEERVSSADSSSAKIRKIKEAYLDFYADCPGKFMLLNSQESTAGLDFTNLDSYQEYLAKLSKFWKIFRSPIQAAIDEGYFRKECGAVEISFSLWSASTGLMNLMINVMETTNCEDFKKMPNKSEYQMQLTRLNHKDMLENLWEAIIKSYQ